MKRKRPKDTTKTESGAKQTKATGGFSHDLIGNPGSPRAAAQGQKCASGTDHSPGGALSSGGSDHPARETPRGAMGHEPNKKAPV
jgi:hypothetical protein